MHGNNDENSKGDCSEDKWEWMTIYSYQADNRDRKENIGGWGKDYRANKSEKEMCFLCEECIT